MPKGMCPPKAMSNSEKIKPLALATRYHMSVIKNSVKKFFKFHSNLLKAFRVDLKACLGLVLPNQYCLIIIRENCGWFFGGVFVGHAQTFVVPTIQYYHTI